MDNSYDMDEGFHLLQSRFIQKLKEHIPALEQFRIELDSEKISHKNEVFMYIHKLAGSAKTFGFPELNEQASFLDKFFGSHEGELTAIPQGIKIALDLLLTEAKQVVDIPAELVAVTHDKHDEEAYDFYIMVVDDDELIRGQIKLALSGACRHEVYANLVTTPSREKCKVTLVESGIEALECLEDRHLRLPDLILLDVNMTDMDGFEVLERLKKEPRLSEIPVIMITARDCDEDVIRGITSGAVDYVSKPFEISVLVKKIINTITRKTVKILIADDDELICSLLKQHFYRMGYTVLTTKNGIDTLEKIQKEHVDIAILDIMMPGMDGLSILRNMKENPETADIPVVILTAKNQQENILEGLETGAYDYITKPFDVEEVAIRVSGILHRNKCH